MTTITSTDAQFAQTQIRKSTRGVSEASANLASGLKKNANVADLSVGTVLRTRVSTLRTTVVNAGQAKSLLNTAKGALEVIADLLQKQKALAVKAADDSLTSNERGFLNQEFQAIVTEIDRIADNTNFNGKQLIDGSISGQANLNSKTGEPTREQYSLVAAGNYALSGTVSSGDLATSSTLGIVAGDVVGETRTINILDFTQGATGGASTFKIDDGAANTITISYTATASDSTATATAFVTAALAHQVANPTSVSANLVFIDNGDGSVIIKAAELGDVYNGYRFANVTGTNLTIKLGSGGAVTLDATLGTTDEFSDSALNTGVDRATTTAQDTFNTTLLGGLANFTASVDTDNNRYVATFTVDVNGTTYVSQAVYLLSSGGNSYIQNSQAITFYDPNGPVTSGGALTDNVFTLTVGTANITVDDGGGTTSAADVAQVRESLNTIANGFETQLASNKITQDRNPNLTIVSSSDPDIVGAQGTFLEGIEGYDINETTTDPSDGTKGDIIFRTDGFGSSGEIGSVGSFSFNRDTGVLTTTIDGVIYSADLTSTSDTTATTGQGYLSGGTAYSTSTGVFTTSGATIVLATDDTTDGRELRIDLNTNVDNNITKVNITSAEAEAAFEGAFNSVFGVSANDSLSFQVGNESTDSIGISISSSKTNSIYKNDSGVIQTLSITSLANAQAASNVLDNAINTNISLIAEVKAAITSFDSAIENNLASIENADAARSLLLDTDFSQESTFFAESTVRQDAGVAVLAQLNSRIQNLLQLLR